MIGIGQSQRMQFLEVSNEVVNSLCIEVLKSQQFSISVDVASYIFNLPFGLHNWAADVQ